MKCKWAVIAVVMVAVMIIFLIWGRVPHKLSFVMCEYSVDGEEYVGTDISINGKYWTSIFGTALDNDFKGWLKIQGDPHQYEISYATTVREITYLIIDAYCPIYNKADVGDIRLHSFDYGVLVIEREHDDLIYAVDPRLSIEQINERITWLESCD